MKFLKACTVILCIATTGYGQVQAPYVVNSAGSNYSSNGYNVEWSIGELSLVTGMATADSSTIVTNGFLQPYPVKASLAGNVLVPPSVISVFPNPTSDFITLNFQQAPAGQVGVQLYSETGQMVYQKIIVSKGFAFSETINMKKLRNGLYILKVSILDPLSQDNIQYEGYKVIKQ
jgi:hypothetical protein